MMDRCEGEYVLIGPLLDSSLREVELRDHPHKFSDVFLRLEELGINCVYGSWLIEDSPSVILVDIAKYRFQKHEICREMFEHFSIRVDINDPEIVDASIFGYIVFKLLQFV